MASSDFLRKNKNQHSAKNTSSKVMDKDIDLATYSVIKKLQGEFSDIKFVHEKRMHLTKIIAALSRDYPKYSALFSEVTPKSFITPDGGFLFAENSRGERRLILISEVKRQGTNDRRLVEGKKEQAKGNAIERLGKNLIGIRTIFKSEGILPFVVFGSGVDFKTGSTIVDRVKTMNEFFPLNKLFIEKDYLPFEPVSMFFRHEEWTIKEMTEIMYKIAKKAISYKFN